jgi:hypothetical protein
MTWVLPGPPGADEMFAYEAALNDFAPRYPQVLLCMYDLQRFGAGMLVDAVATHPRLLIGSLLMENPWFTPSGGDELLTGPPAVTQAALSRPRSAGPGFAPRPARPPR